MSVTATTTESRLVLLIRTMRIQQWTKNVFVLSPLLFSLHLLDPSALMHAVIGFLLFSLIASSIYILNDIVDADVDRSHPVKRQRPIVITSYSIHYTKLYDP